MYFYYKNSQKIVTSFHLPGYSGCNLKMSSGESLFLFSGHLFNTKYIDCHVTDQFCTSIFNNHALTIIQFLNIWLCRFCSVSIHCSDMSFCVMGCAIVRRMSFNKMWVHIGCCGLLLLAMCRLLGSATHRHPMQRRS